MAHLVLSHQSTEFVSGTVYMRDESAFSIKGQIENRIGFADLSDSVRLSTTIAQFCHFTAKEAVHNI